MVRLPATSYADARVTQVVNATFEVRIVKAGSDGEAQTEPCASITLVLALALLALAQALP